MRFNIGQRLIDILRFKRLKQHTKQKKMKNMHWCKRVQLLNPQLGKYSYIGDGSVIADKNTVVGKYCSIASNVTLGTGSHPKNFLSTHPFQYFNFDNGDTNNKGFVVQIPPSNLVKFDYSKPCHIGNDVWIGVNSVIMDGVTVGDGAIIGAHSTITKDVPPYAIVVGVNRIIGYRFSPTVIKQLLDLKWWDLDEEQLYDLPFNDIDACIIQLNTLRQKIPAKN